MNKNKTCPAAEATASSEATRARVQVEARCELARWEGVNGHPQYSGQPLYCEQNLPHGRSDGVVLRRRRHPRARPRGGVREEQRQVDQALRRQDKRHESER